MSKNIWIYVAGIVTIITTIILGLLIPHLSISLYYVALGFFSHSRVCFFSYKWLSSVSLQIGYLSM